MDWYDEYDYNDDSCLNRGSKRRFIFEEALKPEELLKKLRTYQDVLGDQFGLTELLQLEDIRVKAMTAQAINDLPEFLLDQVNEMSQNDTFDPSALAEAVSDVAEALRRYY